MFFPRSPLRKPLQDHYTLADEREAGALKDLEGLVTRTGHEMKEEDENATWCVNLEKVQQNFSLEKKNAYYFQVL